MTVDSSFIVQSVGLHVDGDALMKLYVYFFAAAVSDVLCSVLEEACSSVLEAVSLFPHEVRENRSDIANTDVAIFVNFFSYNSP